MKKNILVTATGGRSVGSGILHALTRTTQEVRDRWNVISADADPFAWGLYKTEKSVLLPSAREPQYMNSLNEIISQNNIDAVVPGSEPEADLLSGNLTAIPVPVICNKHELMPLMMNKFRTVELLKELNLPYIETYPVNEWKDATKKYDYPFVVKPTVGTGGSKGLHFVFSEKELLALLPHLSADSAYCLQPYIGTGDDEYTVGVLSDKDGKIIDSIVMRRKLTGLSLLHSKKHNNTDYAISTGYSQGFFIKEPHIQEFCEDLAVKLGSRGPLNIQLRLTGKEILVFEIHPRFSGTSAMRADVGFNEADILLQNILFDKSFGRLAYRYNVAAIRAFEHVIVPMDNMLSR